MGSKSNAFPLLKAFMIKTQFDILVKFIRSDNALEVPTPLIDGSSLIMASSTRLLVQTLHNKMVWWRGNISFFWKLQELCFFNPIYLSSSYSQLPTLLIDSTPLYSTINQYGLLYGRFLFFFITYELLVLFVSPPSPKFKGINFSLGVIPVFSLDIPGAKKAINSTISLLSSLSFPEMCFAWINLPFYSHKSLSCFVLFSSLIRNLILLQPSLQWLILLLLNLLVLFPFFLLLQGDLPKLLIPQLIYNLMFALFHPPYLAHLPFPLAFSLQLTLLH